MVELLHRFAHLSIAAHSLFMVGVALTVALVLSTIEGPAEPDFDNWESL